MVTKISFEMRANLLEGCKKFDFRGHHKDRKITYFCIDFYRDEKGIQLSTTLSRTSSKGARMKEAKAVNSIILVLAGFLCRNIRWVGKAAVAKMCFKLVDDSWEWEKEQTCKAAVSKK